MGGAERERFRAIAFEWRVLKLSAVCVCVFVCQILQRK